jgi:hypothetical protein
MMLVYIQRLLMLKQLDDYDKVKHELEIMKVGSLLNYAAFLIVIY